MNKLLECQLRTHFRGADKVPEHLSELLNVISGSYDHYEKDQKVIENSMELSSKEMIELNNQLKKENDELKKAHKELKTVLEGVDEIFYSVDMVSLKILQISDACEKVYGYTSAEFLADRGLWQKVILPEDIHIVYKHIKELYEGKQAMGQYRIIHKDKSIRWLESKIIPALDKEGQLLRMDSVTNDISERKRAEKELEKSISILEATLESTADGILVTDFSGKIIRLNKKFVELWRIPREILDKQDDEKIIAFVIDQLTNPEEFLSKVKELCAHQKDVSFDILKFKDGRTFERYSKPQLINGNCVGRVWSFRDMTESKKAEDKIKESELRYRSLVDQSTDTICIIDTTLKFNDINPSGCRMFGYSKEEILQLSLADVLLNEDLKTNALKINELKSGKTINNERRIKRKDGTLMEAELSGKMLEDGRIMVFGRDIAERKKTEQKLITTSVALQQALHDLNKIMNSSLDVICAVDEKGYFIQVSAACETVWGYTADELIGKPLINFVYHEDSEKTQITADRVMAGNNIGHFENRYIRKDGSLVPIEWSARWDENDKIRYGVARDVTEKKRLERSFEIERQRFNDMFFQAPSSMGMLKGANHVYEMANPLYLQLIGKKDIIGKSVKEILPEIEEQGFIEILDRVYKTGKSFSANEMLIKLDKNGNGELAEMYLNFIYQAYTNKDGNIEGIFFFAIDVTEQVFSRKKIEESELRYRSLVEQATDAICITDASMKFIDINPYALGTFGYTLEEALQLSLPDILFAEDLAANPIKLNDLKLGITTRNERRLKRKDGTAVDMAVSTKLLEDGRLIMFGHDISERKKSEEALRESEKRLRKIIDLVPHFIFAKDAKGKFILVNEAVATAYGSTVEGLIGKSDADFNPKKEEVEYFMQEDLKVINSGNAKYNIEETITDATGNIRMLSTTKIPYTSSGLDTPGVLGVSVDISEHKKAEAILKENEGQLSIAAQIAKLGYWEFDVTKNLFKFNDHFYSIFKTTAEEVGGYTMSSERYLSLFVHPDDYSIVANVAANAIRSPDPYYNEQIEHRIKYAGGGIGYMAVRFFTVKNESGRTAKTYGAIQDITEKKNAEAALVKRDNQLTLAAQIARLGYWEFDVLNDLFTFTDQFYAIFKTTAEKVGGYTMSSARYTELFVHPDEREIVGKSVAEAINSGDSHFSFEAEHRIIYADGEIGYISVHFYIAKDEEGRTIKTFGVNQDITDRKKGEETLLRSEAKLELKNKELELKNKELEQFAYVASHDMQEPLRTTSSFVELLQKQYNGRLDEKADKYLTFIAQSSDRMKVLIKDLLDYSRIGRKKELAKVDCTIMLNEVLADLGKAINEANAEIKADDLPVINGYSTEIKQLFQNLIINAIKFRKQNTSPDINFSVQKKGGYWEFAVKDNGIGIDEQHRERIFIIFQRLHTRNEYEGSGIGLAHCKKIVELHGGKIWIESIPGEGSTFHFTIPENNN